MITELDEQQQQAVTRCVDMSHTNRVVPVHGEPGTGKTSILSHVYRELDSAGYDVVMCAPTGKAAKRIHEATGIRAMTIHRLLEYPYPGERDDKGHAMAPGIPRRSKNNPLQQRAVLADEYMMVNRELHSNLIFALPPGGVVRMFGDLNQLRPIEQGKLAGSEAPFEQAVKRFEGVQLSTLHRTGAGTGIAENVRLIAKGRIPKRRDDFTLHVTDYPVKAIEELCLANLDDNIVNFGSNNGQIISPTKKSWVGTYRLNVTLQRLFNPGISRLPLARHTWDSKMPISVAEGDKVIWTENAYDLRNEWERYAGDYDSDSNKDPRDFYIPVPDDKWIMNGETGIIVYMDSETTHINCGDRVVKVPNEQTVIDRKGNMRTFDPRRSIDLAYCITTHKAQGSEWPHVMYVLNKSTGFMQSRPNIYTGVSRAQEHVYLVTDQRSLSNSVFQTQTSMERQATQVRNKR